MSTKKGMMTGPKRRPPSLEYKIRQIIIFPGRLKLSDPLER